MLASMRRATSCVFYRTSGPAGASTPHSGSLWLGKNIALALILGVGAISLLFAACAVGPKYRRPDVPTPPKYKEQQAVSGTDQWKTANPSDGSLRSNWWETFGDPQLNRLEEMIAVSNQNVKQAEAQFRQARALVAVNRAGYKPTVTTQPAISSSYTSHNLGARGFGGGTFNQFNLPFGVSWEPNFWGRISLAVENAVAAAQASAADLQNMRLSMQADLAADYFQLEGLDMEEQLLRDTIAAYEKALELTKVRNSVGVASRTDVVQAQTQLDSTSAQLTDLGVARAQFEHAIAVITGQPPSTFSIPAGQIRGVPPPVPAGVPSQLLERRPDIAAGERVVAEANAQIGLAQVAYYPLVNLGLNAGFQSSRISDWFTWPSRFWSLGPSAVQTLLDFGRRHAQTQQTMAAYDATVASYRQTVLSAFQEVEDNLAALGYLAREAVEQDAAVKGAEEALKLESDRYKAGTVSYLDVITSQTIALTNERAAVQILQRRMTADVQLIRALGGGWDVASLPTK